MYLAARRAIYSAALSIEAAATLRKLHVSFLLEWKGWPHDHQSLHIDLPQIPAHMEIIGLHTIRPTPMCRTALLEQCTDAPSQTHLGYADHSHMGCSRQKPPQCLQQELAKRACQRNSWAKWEINSSQNDPYPLPLALKRLQARQ